MVTAWCLLAAMFAGAVSGSLLRYVILPRLLRRRGGRS